jgi:hypothetical protein
MVRYAGYEGLAGYGGNNGWLQWLCSIGILDLLSGYGMLAGDIAM